MLTSIIPLFESYLSSGIFNYVLRYIFALAFLATVPIIIMSCFRR